MRYFYVFLSSEKTQTLKILFFHKKKLLRKRYAKKITKKKNSHPAYGLKLFYKYANKLNDFLKIIFSLKHFNSAVSNIKIKF